MTGSLAGKASLEITPAQWSSSLLFWQNSRSQLSWVSDKDNFFGIKLQRDKDTGLSCLTSLINKQTSYPVCEAFLNNIPCGTAQSAQDYVRLKEFFFLFSFKLFLILF